MKPRQLQQCFADVCSPGGCGGNRGWTARYVQQNNTHWKAQVELLVTDLSEIDMVAFHLPFVIDTGASVTIIPRGLLQKGVFRPEAGEIYRVVGVGGSPVTGKRFAAALSLTPNHSECETLIFHPVRLFVSDTMKHVEHGLLGLDALRQVVTTFDKYNVTFRRPTLERHG